jgi:phytol kinase
MLIEFIKGFGLLVAYYLVFIAIAVVMRKFIDIPSEIFRKMLHLIVLASVFIFTYGFQTWWISCIAAISFIILIFPVLSLLERLEGFSWFFVERKSGELKLSLIVGFAMFAILTAAGWGLFDKKYIVVVSVLAWGFGDATAALFGKRFGKHYITGKLVEGCKTLEGSLSMYVISFITVSVILLAEGAFVWYVSLLAAALTAAACTAVELYTRNGMDTITCPLASAAVIILFNHFWRS